METQAPPQTNKKEEDKKGALAALIALLGGKTVVVWLVGVGLASALAGGALILGEDAGKAADAKNKGVWEAYNSRPGRDVDGREAHGFDAYGGPLNGGRASGFNRKDTTQLAYGEDEASQNGGAGGENGAAGKDGDGKGGGADDDIAREAGQAGAGGGADQLMNGAGFDGGEGNGGKTTGDWRKRGVFGALGRSLYGESMPGSTSRAFLTFGKDNKGGAAAAGGAGGKGGSGAAGGKGSAQARAWQGRGSKGGIRGMGNNYSSIARGLHSNKKLSNASPMGQLIAANNLSKSATRSSNPEDAANKAQQAFGGSGTTSGSPLGGAGVGSGGGGPSGGSNSPGDGTLGPDNGGGESGDETKPGTTDTKDADHKNVTPWQEIVDHSKQLLVWAAGLLAAAWLLSKLANMAMMAPWVAGAMRVAAKIIAGIALVLGVMVAIEGARIMAQGQKMQGGIFLGAGALVGILSTLVLLGGGKPPTAPEIAPPV